MEENSILGLLEKEKKLADEYNSKSWYIDNLEKHLLYDTSEKAAKEPYRYDLEEEYQEKKRELSNVSIELGKVRKELGSHLHWLLNIGRV